MADFVSDLTKEIVEKRGVAQTTADGYIKVLFAYSPVKPFKNLAFLRKTDEVMKKLAEYAESTQKTHLASITSVLSIVKDKPAYKKVYDFYYGKMMEKAKPENEATEDTSQKSDTQKENWLSWEEVKKRRDELVKEVSTADFGLRKTLSADQFESLRDALILSLYTELRPRRNQDYMNMKIVRKWKEDMPKDTNYLDLDWGREGKNPKQFVFNVYKTAKKYGEQKCEIPSEGSDIKPLLLSYIQHHPARKTGNPKLLKFPGGGIPFLVSADGKPLESNNAITRILNRIFKKKIGSSMLRHIFLSDKYDVEEMKQDACGMGHSIQQQREYLKSDAT